MSSEQLDGIRKCLRRSDSRSQPRQGPKPGRKRRWRGFPGAPSGAGRGVSPRVPRIGTELGAWSSLRPADGVRGRGGRGDMFGRGSYAIVRRCKSSIFFRSNSECDGGVCVLADTICWDLRGLRAICEVAVHRWFLTGRRYENFRLRCCMNFKGHYISRKKDRGGRDSRSKRPPRAAHC